MMLLFVILYEIFFDKNAKIFEMNKKIATNISFTVQDIRNGRRPVFGDQISAVNEVVSSKVVEFFSRQIELIFGEKYYRCIFSLFSKNPNNLYIIYYIIHLI